MTYLVVLDGATGSGKSTLLAAAGAGRFSRTVAVPKLTTRAKRRGDTASEFTFVPEIQPDTNLLRWGAVGSDYAVDTSQIRRSLDRNRIPVVVCTDSRAQAELNAEFGTYLVYVYRPISQDEFERLMSARGVSNEVAELRRSELHEIPTDYLSKISRIDSVILNLSSEDNLISQFDAILSSKPWPHANATKATQGPR